MQEGIDDHIAGQHELHGDAQLLRSIQAIGVVAVAKALAYADDVSRFDRFKARSAFAGVCPQQRLSGTSVKGRTLVSKPSHADLRRSPSGDWNYCTRRG